MNVNRLSTCPVYSLFLSSFFLSAPAAHRPPSAPLPPPQDSNRHGCGQQQCRNLQNGADGHLKEEEDLLKRRPIKVCCLVRRDTPSPSVCLLHCQCQYTSTSSALCLVIRRQDIKCESKNVQKFKIVRFRNIK